MLHNPGIRTILFVLGGALTGLGINRLVALSGAT